MKKIPYVDQIIRSKRKTIAIQITPEGQVLVRCPQKMWNHEIARFVSSKADWICRNLDRIREAPPIVCFSEAELRELVMQAKAAIPERVAYFADVLGVTYGRVSIRCQKGRWGSCSSKGNLNFNCLLMLVPPEIRDYVIVHELCHRKEMNHSPHFWAKVGQILPDYPLRRKWLREQGQQLIARIGK